MRWRPTQAQIDVLLALEARPDGAPTSKRTGCGVVSGVSASALHRRGLVKLKRDQWSLGWDVVITDAGRGVLAAWRAQR